MKKTWILLLVAIVLVAVLTVPAFAATETHDHSSWTKLTDGAIELGSGNYYFDETDKTVATSITVQSGAKITICLCGHTWSGDTGRPLYIPNGKNATVTICDCSANPGTVQGNASLDGNGAAIYVHSGSAVHMYDVTVQGANISDTGDSGGAISANYGAFYMYSGTITGGTAVNGGNIYVNQGQFHFLGGAITGGNATSGGNVYINTNGTFNMGNDGEEDHTNVQITGGISSGEGGNIFVNDTSGTLKLKSGTISGGKAQGSATANSANIRIYKGKLTMTGGVITGYVSRDSSQPGTVTVSGKVVIGAYDAETGEPLGGIPNVLEIGEGGLDPDSRIVTSASTKDFAIIPNTDSAIATEDWENDYEPLSNIIQSCKGFAVTFETDGIYVRQPDATHRYNCICGANGNETHLGDCKGYDVLWEAKTLTGSVALPYTSGGYYYLVDGDADPTDGNVTVTHASIYPTDAGRVFYIDLNGLKVSSLSDKKIISLNADGTKTSTMVIMDSSRDSNGKPTGALIGKFNGTNADGGAVLFSIYSGHVVNLYRVTIDASAVSINLGAAIRNAGTMNLYNCTVIGGNASVGAGGAIHNSGTMLLKNSTVSGGTAKTTGGNIYLNGGSLTLDNSTVSGGHATTLGGNIYANGSKGTGAVNLIKGEVIGGTAGTNGGNIYVDGGILNVGAEGETDNTLTKVTGFSEATEEFNATIGGNIYIGGVGTFNLYSGTVSGGRASDVAGNIRLDGTMTMTGGIVKDGIAGTGDYNMQMYGGSLTMSGGEIAGYVYRHGSNPGTVTVSGDAKIGAFDAQGNPIEGINGTIVIDEGGLSSNAKIVSTAALDTMLVDKGALTNEQWKAYEAYADRIVTNDSGRIVLHEFDGIYIRVAHYACICGANEGEEHLASCDGTPVLWQPHRLTGTNTLPGSSGYYYLVDNDGERNNKVNITKRDIWADGIKKDIYIDLNGLEISISGNRMINMQANALVTTLVITDSSVGHTGKLISTWENAAEEGGVLLNNGTKNVAELYRVTIDATDVSVMNSAAIRNLGTLNIYNSTVKGGTASVGAAGAIYTSGNMLIKDSSVSGGTATTSGGNIYIAGGETTLDNTTVSGGNAKEGGNILITGANTVFNLVKGEVKDGVATKDGGNIHVNNGTFNMGVVGETDNTLVKITDGKVINDGASGDFFGGNIFVAGTGTFNMKSGTVSGGTAPKAGNIRLVGDMTMSGGVIKDGTSSKQIPANNIFIYDGDLTMTGGEIKGYISRQSGHLGTVTVSGDVKIGAYDGSGNPVHGVSGLLIIGEGGLDENAKIVSTSGNGTMIIDRGALTDEQWAGYEAYISCIISNSDLLVAREANGIYLRDGRYGCICGANEGEEHIGSCDGTPVLWKAYELNGSSALPGGSGYYYLVDNDGTADNNVIVTGRNIWADDVKKDIYIDLNGLEISISGARMINMQTNALVTTLVITDSSVGHTGKLISTWENANEEGGILLNNGSKNVAELYRVVLDASAVSIMRGAAITNAGTVKIYNSTITGGNVTTNGGSIYNNGDLLIQNTTVSGGTAAVAGGNICQNDGSVTLLGATVTGGTVATGGNDYILLKGTLLIGDDEEATKVVIGDISLANAETITIGEAGLASGSSIGVTAADDVAFTGAIEIEDVEYFTSNVAERVIVFDTNGLLLSTSGKFSVHDLPIVFNTLADALQFADGNNYITLHADVTDNISVTKTIFLDLNGHTISGNVSVADQMTLKLFDTKTADYDVEGGYGKITGTVTGTIARTCNTPKATYGSNYRYLVIKDEEGYHAHRIYLAVTSTVLSPNGPSLNYRTALRCDSVVADYINNGGAYGVELAANDAAKSAYSTPVVPSAGDENLLTTKLTNVFDPSKQDTWKTRAETDVAARAYITVKDQFGQDDVFSSAQVLSFNDALEAADDLPGLTVQQQKALGDMYEKYKEALEWENTVQVDNIPTWAGSTLLKGCMCGDANSTNNPCAAANHPKYVWQPWNSTDSLPEDTGNYYLTGNVDISGYVVPEGVFVCINTNGYTITSSGRLAQVSGILNLVNYNHEDATNFGGNETSSISIKGLTGTDAFGGLLVDTTGNVSIYDGVNIQATNDSTINRGLVYVRGYLNVYGGTITGMTLLTDDDTIDTDGCGGAVYVTSDGKFFMNNGTVYGGEGNVSGGAIYSNGAVKICGDALISGGQATNGGAIYVNSGTFTIDGATVTGGNSTAAGGNVYINNGTTLNLLKGQITSGQSTTGGGNIYVNQGAFNMGAESDTDNTLAQVTGGNAGTNGGNIYVRYARFNMYSGTVSGGEATNGGNIGMNGTTTINLKKGEVKDGIATGNGGNIYVDGGTLNMGTEGETDNTLMKVYHTSAEGYKAEIGGNIFIGAGTYNLMSGTVSGGRANNVAGNIRLAGTMNMSGGIIQDGYARTNTDTNNLMIYDGTLTMTSGEIAGYVGRSTGHVGTVTLSGDVKIGAYDENEAPVHGVGGTLLIGEGGLGENAKIVSTAAADTMLVDRGQLTEEQWAACEAYSKRIVSSVADTTVTFEETGIYVRSTANAVRYNCICGANEGEEHLDGCNGYDVLWEAYTLTGTKSLPGSGNYYLVEDDGLADNKVVVTERKVWDTSNRRNMRIDLNGLEVSSTARLFSLQNDTVAGTSLVITDSSTGHTGALVGELNAANTDGGAVLMFVGNLHTVNMYRVKIDASAVHTNLAAAIKNGGSTVNMYNTTVIGGDANVGAGGAIHNSGTMLLKNSTVSGGTAKTTGGNIYLNGGSLTLDNSTVSGGQATTLGGNIYVNGSNGTGVVNLIKGEVVGGTAGTNGGNIYVDGGILNVGAEGETDNTLAKVTGFSEATEDYNAVTGGNIYIGGVGTFNLYSGTISGGRASDVAGNIRLDGTMTMTGGIVKDGIAGTGNYNMQMFGGSLTMSGGEIAGYVYRHGSNPGTVTVSGDAKIGAYGENNVPVHGINGELVIGQGGLGENAKIVTTAEVDTMIVVRGEMTDAWDAYEAYEANIVSSLPDVVANFESDAIWTRNAQALQGFQVGYGMAKITPTEEVGLGGYGTVSQRVTNDVLSDLYATCVAITDDSGDTVLLFGVDILTSDYPTDNFLDDVSAATGVPQENIIISASHTHSAPTYSSRFLASIPGTQNARDMLQAGLINAAKDAMLDRKAATMQGGSTETEYLNFVRHYVCNDGSYWGDNFGDKTSGIKAHVSDADSELQAIKFVRQGDKEIWITNFQVHPHKTGSSTGLEISADVVGAFRDSLASTGVEVVYFTGASGNINSHTNLQGETQYTDYLAWGAKLAEYAQQIEFNDLAGGDVKVSTETFTATVNHEFDAYKDLCYDLYTRWTNKEITTAELIQLGAEGGIELHSAYHAGAIVDRADKAATESFAIKTCSFGDVGLIAAPYEMFDTNGVFIKDNSPFDLTVIATCANGSKGYLPSEATFAYDNYEADKTTYVAGTAELLANQFVAMLNALQ